MHGILMETLEEERANCEMYRIEDAKVEDENQKMTPLKDICKLAEPQNQKHIT
jgi:hypothetical protein